MTTPSFTTPDDMPEYISIYDRPNRGKGRPRTCTLTDEAKAPRKKYIAKTHYNENYEYRRLQMRLYNESSNIICFLCKCNIEFSFKQIIQYYIDITIYDNNL